MEAGRLKHKRILYVQYTNPGCYPPLLRSSGILADQGWEILFLGTGVWGTDQLSLPEDPRIRVRQLWFEPAGWRQKIHYGIFHIWCLLWALRWRPSWIYASDLLSAPFAWFARTVLGIAVIFHEHDTPKPGAAGILARFSMWMRVRCARNANVCVIPNERRAADFGASTACSRQPLVIWNCPQREEVAPRRKSPDSRRLRLLYQGSIVPDRLPPTVVEALAALPEGVSLTVVGYETVGTYGYGDRLRLLAAGLGVGRRLELLGPLNHRDLMQFCREYDAGLSLLPMESDDLNVQGMTGASNKAFDYLACGLPLLVSQLPDWEEMFVKPGYGLSCDPRSGQSIAAAVGWLYTHPEDALSMGERGRRRILEDWNYERCFQPLLDLLSADSSQCPKPGSLIPNIRVVAK